eukprot:CAMPEP_0173395790 /NCGR_PEP_ID=MMETSP1356-20130122/33395_1 /TAXON_ID=77927 ORGANISM="Hemiselmis virescens, Strain PCC157" /NCGR_SAMPLE_ID=MMETSP1356 /ASSEMBLY_ACC=CAM_ASM_000847 /LENGTH=78 /DNA_ID=CAMNT_0014354643 /DNA_START=142 /DNA_END=375 /DNA_ORIENTATION=-
MWSRMSSVHESIRSDSGSDMWVPRERCPPTHSAQSTTPKVTEAHVTREALQQSAQCALPGTSESLCRKASSASLPPAE